jgi:hypothetical protein
MTPIAYEFPSPAERPAWEKAVNDGIASGTLVWTHITDQQWRLDGECPRCEDSFGQYFDFDVVVSRQFGGSHFGPGQNRITTQVVCLCDVDPPHRQNTQGCGAGKGLEITLVPPSPPEAGR